MKKLIFLDVDGVLNTDSTWDTEHADGYATLDPVLCDRLKAIHDATNATIVLSSTWRTAKPKGHPACNEAQNEFECMPKLTKWLADRGMTIHSHTPENDSWTYRPRGFEIKFWFTRNPEFQDAQFVILDDLDPWEFRQYKENHIHINWKTGLSDADVEQAIALLS